MRSRLWVTLALGILGTVFTVCNAVAADPDRPSDPNAITPKLTTQEMIFESSKLSDLKVYNRDDTSMKLGSLDDLIINAHTGQVMYGILHTGIVGGEKIPVPWVAFRLERSARDNYYLVLNMTKDQLSSAPTFDRNRWSDLTNQEWQQTVDKFFGVRTAARASSPDMEQHH